METTIAKKETGVRLKKLRENLGYTQEKFSEILGVSVTLYKKMEGGSYNISIRSLRKLKEITGISIDYIMFGEGKKFDDIWILLQNSENSVKLKVLLRLLRYFGYDSQNSYFEHEQEAKYSEFLDTLIDKDKLGEMINSDETRFDNRG